ncbi:MAG: hypothetical protein IJD40_13755 [Lachnospiraceae bacterium]|nr:hypothetical protein [Lachnospiraceae bacterium]
MEKWKKIFPGLIPRDNYEVFLKNGEEQGLVIKLLSKDYVVELNFGMVSAMRMIDEGIILNDYFDNKISNEYEKENFSNTIYEVFDGEFDDFIKKTGGDLYDYCKLRHFVIISLNFVIEIMTAYEPVINIYE